MTVITTSSTSAGRSPADRRSVDVFGVRWPLYKAEAVLVAMVVLALGAVLTAAVGGTNFAPAILAAAGSGAAVWWTARAVHARS
ncbi:putative protein OS=Tsukamurella paurometabola (strain ATCC 8368 / DSM / CCUG 35730 /CIP 100753 / JCM 10117 / KCTC 9821 / NBRC 16120 / NCIMB 702349/ NCTC 13040) OX=521096 GN=Tpau_2619 PE=4 SV=1 [Tsukamurella paurometabola]|uniref:Uncharacterized protein n=1 Tax=Tsukamurella paurometabola (strain ATCC 8368 / DSM 20162 / CCUG 35730 / CIP 100753 / JCM 10117 / KCTC 9821 / NBRC 16120 / NCIMB 702349 / NCTC 13040) TaxID=521096 RepID=D5US17_TSUPD|nr:hypothetical protein [Tsukamurella paurometabola]ADG79222.1 conserved hypothetical protein [Tsukamurella paurometabola DSM 20162]SUP34616.1 Uncharacterised protein [Tsukamurella paurometabola]